MDARLDEDQLGGARQASGLKERKDSVGVNRVRDPSKTSSEENELYRCAVYPERPIWRGHSRTPSKGFCRVGPTPLSVTRASVRLTAIGKVVRRRIPLGGFRERPGHEPLDLLLLNPISRFGDGPRGTITPQGRDSRRRGECDADDRQDRSGELLPPKALSRATPTIIARSLENGRDGAAASPWNSWRRKVIREFLDRVYDQAVTCEGENPGRTANKAREHLHDVLYLAWEQKLIDTLPRFPAPRVQRDVAGRHYLTKSEINALYFATHQMGRPRGWDAPHPIGRYWRIAMVVFFNCGVDTGTVRRSTPPHEPILWRHVIWDPKSPDREAKERSPWGWLFYAG